MLSIEKALNAKHSSVGGDTFLKAKLEQLLIAVWRPIFLS